MNGPVTLMLDRTVFYDLVRAGLFGGRLTEGQFRGIEAILDEWRRRALPDLRWLAYILATAFHETGTKMLPVRLGQVADPDGAATI